MKLAKGDRVALKTNLKKIGTFIGHSSHTKITGVAIDYCDVVFDDKDEVTSWPESSLICILDLPIALRTKLYGNLN